MQNCKAKAAERWTPFGEEIDIFQGGGCEACEGSGYKGRAGIFELMELNDELRHMIMGSADASRLTEAVRGNGMKSLREDGWMKVAQGMTTAAEVTRVTQEF